MPTAGHYDFLYGFDEQGEASQRSFRKRRPEIVTRGVCAACNNGWMNDLDLKTEAMVTTMVKGRSLTVTNLLNKALLARWVCKVAIFIDSMQSNEPALNPDHAHWLFQHQTPPPGWNIWLASVARFEEYHATLGGFTLVRPEGRGYLATVAINHFVAQAMVLPPPEPVGNHPLSDHVTQLWPPTPDPTDWPPKPLEDTERLADFGRIIAAYPVRTSSPPPQVPLT